MAACESGIETVFTFEYDTERALPDFLANLIVTADDAIGGSGLGRVGRRGSYDMRSRHGGKRWNTMALDSGEMAGSRPSGKRGELRRDLGNGNMAESEIARAPWPVPFHCQVSMVRWSRPHLHYLELTDRERILGWTLPRLCKMLVLRPCT